MVYRYLNGYNEWYKNGELHRLDGPAIENYDGPKKWYLNGKLHRENELSKILTELNNGILMENLIKKKIMIIQISIENYFVF